MRIPLTGEPKQIVLRVEEVHRSFREGARALEVLCGITLKVSRGELTLLMGPSGSGKTTLLTIMGLLLKPTAGRVILLGRDVTDLSESALPALRRRHIGFIFQSFNLLSALNAAENVEVTLALQGSSGRRARQRALELLDRVGLADRWHHRPEELSGGEKQRVAVARALASPAELILADEPTGNLDSRISTQVVELLRQLAHEQNRAVLIVTHDQSLRRLADRVTCLRDGRLADNGLELTSQAGTLTASQPEADRLFVVRSPSVDPFGRKMGADRAHIPG